MQNITAIDPAWLPSIGASLKGNVKIAENPPPRYDKDADCLRCHARASYGPHIWELPPTELPFPDVPDKYKWFARLFLEGQIFPALETYKNHFDAHPMLLTKTFSQPRVVALLQPLIDSKIASKKQLLEKWEEDPQFLLSAVSMWIKPSHRQYLAVMWPPTDPKKLPLALKGNKSISGKKAQK